MQIKPKKLYTPQEANRTLPLVRRIVADIADTYRRLTESCESTGSSNTSEIKGLDTAHREELDEVIERIETDKKLLCEYVEELDKLGVLLKGPLDGLVDFPALRHEEVVFLCWRAGEPEVAHWHSVDDGFRGRQPIDEAEFVAPGQSVQADMAAPNPTRPIGDPNVRKDMRWNSSRSS